MKNFTQISTIFCRKNFNKLTSRLGLIVFVFISAVSFGQTAAQYTMTPTSGTYTALTTPTAVTVSAADDGFFNGIPIGFSFTFAGTAYTQINVATNGYMTLGTVGTPNNISTATAANSLTGTIPFPIIAPLWDDLALSSTTGISYISAAGSSPNRITTVQYSSAKWTYSATAAVIEFQVKFYENGKIEFIYNSLAGTQTAPAVGTNGASIGLASATGVHLSLSSAGTAPTLSTSTGTSTITGKPATGQTYTFSLPYTSVANTDWNTASTWNLNAVPPAGSNVIINTNVTAATTPTNQVSSITVNSGFTLSLNAAYTNPLGKTITVNSGGKLALAGNLTNTGTTTINGTLQINGGGYASGTAFSYAATGSTLIMNHNIGLYGISTGQAFWPTALPPFNVTIQGTGAQINNTVGTVAGTLTINSQLACAATPSVTVSGSAILAAQLSNNANGNFLSNGTLQINLGGYVSTSAPTYGSASTLIYNSGSTSGSPYGVTTEWTGSSATAGVGIPNNVTIQGNTFITMPNGNRGISDAFNVTAGSGITLNATSGDLSIGGNFTQNGTLTNSGRAINFFGTTTTTQTITGTGLNGTGATNCFAYFLNNTTGTGGVTIGVNTTIDGASGEVLQLLNAGPLKIGAFTLTLNGNGGNILTSGGVRVIDFTSASGILLIKGTTGTLKTVTSLSTGSLSITSSVAGGQVQVQSGGFNCGSSLTTIQTGSFLTINSGGYVDTNSPTYATGSTLSFRTGASYGVGSGDKTWASGASGVGVPDKVQINAASTNVSINDNKTARTSITVTAGTLTNNTNTLTVATGASASSAFLLNGGEVINGGGTIAIGSAATTTTSALNISSGSLTNSSGTINIATAGTTGINAFGITGGTLTNSGGIINIGPSGGGNQGLVLGGGTITLSSGTINLNGNFSRGSGGGTFTQSGGLLSIDGNSGTAGTSTASTKNMFDFISATGTGLNCTAGTIRIVDPPHSSLLASTTKAVSLSYSTTAPTSFQFSGSHTFEFGDGTSATGGNTDGFVIDTWVGSFRVPLQNVTVNSGATANRWVSTAYTAGNGTNINGTLTINANCEFRNTTALTTTPFTISGNIVNNGTLTTSQTIQFALNGVAGGAPTTNTTAQTVSGSGVYRNLAASPTAKFTNLIFNNSTAGSAATFSIGDVTASGTVTLTNGIINIGNNNSFNFVGTASAVARTNGYVLIQGTGQMKKDLASGVNTFTFHVGENTGTTEYSPYFLSFSANSLARTIGVRPVDAIHPDIDNVDVQTDYISRYWQVSNSAAGTYTYTSIATYLAADINGTEGNIKMGLWNGTSPWIQAVSSASANALTISTGLTETTGPLSATADFTGRVKGSTTYTWNQTGTAAYTLSTNWTPERATPAANDILVFDGTATPTPTVTGFASETISKLVLTNNANVNLQPAADATLTIAGGTGTDLEIPSGSTLNLSGGASVGLAFSGTTTTSIAGTLTFSSTVGTHTLNLTNTIATVTGTINLSSTSIATVTSSSTTLLMNAGSTLNITNTMTVIPLATWDTTSTIVFSGSGTTFTNNTQSFGNFTYNSSVITSTVSFFTTTTTAVIKGNLNISATGTGRFRALTSGTLSVNGNVNVSNAAVADFMSGAATFTLTGNVNVSNTAVLNIANGAGTNNIGGSVTASDAAIINFGNGAGANTTTITGNLNLNSSATSVLSLTSGSTQVVNVAGNFNQTAGTLSMGTGTGAGTLKVAGTFTAISLNNVGTGTANLIEFNGTSSQAVSPGASVTGVINFKVSNPSGIAVTGTLPLNAGTTFTAASSGTAVTSGTVAYSTTTTLAYVTAVGTQTTGNEFPSTNGPVNVTFNNTNASRTITVSDSRTVTGTITLTSGRVTLGANNLTLDNGGTLTATSPSATNMIVTDGAGLFKRGIPATTGTYLFPIGETTGTTQYSPVSLQFNANSDVRIIGAKVIDAVSGNMNTPSSPTNYLSRYWTFSENGAGGTYNYYINPAVAVTGAEDENGTTALIKAAYWDGSAWTTSTGSYTTGSFASNAVGVSETAAPLGTVEWTGRDNPPVSYTWVGFTDTSWNTATNWSPNGIPSSSDSVTLANGSTGAAANLSLTTAVTVNNLTFNGSGNFFSVGASPAAITVLGTVTYTAGTGSWNATSTFAISSASSQTIPAFAYGNLTGTGGARVWSTGTTGIAGTFTPGAGTYTATSGSTVDYTGSGSQNIGSVNYYNLTNSGNGGRTLVSGTIDVANSYTPTTATTTSGTANVFNFSSASAQTIPASSYATITNTGNGNRTFASSGTVTIAGTVFTPGSGTYTVTGSTVALTSTTGFNLTLPTVSSGNSFNILTINGTGGTFALPYAATTQNLANTLNIQAGTFVTNPASNTTALVNNIAVGTINLSGGTLDDKSTGGVVTTTNLLISTAWNQTGGLATVNGAGFAKLIFTGGGSTTYTGLTLSASINFYSLQVSNNTTLTLGSNFQVNGITGGTTITVDAGSTYNGSTFVSSTASATNTFLINGTFKTSNLTGFSGATTTAFSTTNSPTITLGANSIVEYNAASTQTVTNRTDYANLTLTGGSKTIGSTALTLSKVLTINSGATYNGAANPALTIGGNFLNSGTFTQGTGLLTFNGTAIQTVGGTTASTFNNVTVSGAAGGLSLGNSQTINGTLTLSALSGGTIDLNGSNNITLGATATITGETCSRQFINGGSPTQGNGYIQTTRTFVSGTNYLGVAITSATSLGSTTIKRFVQKAVSSVGAANSIKRVYSITPTTAATGNVTLTSSYCDGELNSNTESSPGLITYYGTGADETTGFSSFYSTASNNATANTVTTPATGSLIAGQNNITLANPGSESYYTVQNGDWNTAATWALNSVPPASVATTIKNAVTINAAVTNAPTSVTINASKSLTFGSSGTITTKDVTNNGSLVMTDGGSLTIANDGTIANGSSTFTGGTGTIITSGTATFTGTLLDFNNLTLNGALTNSATTASVKSTLKLNQGGTVSGTAFTYDSGATSTVSYSGTATQTATALEFPSTSGPTNVIVNNANGFRLPFSRTVSGDFTVTSGDVQNQSGAGVTLTMTGTAATIAVNGSITGTNVGSGNDINLVYNASGILSVSGSGSLSRFLNVTVGTSSTLALSRTLQVMYGTFAVNGTLRIDAGGAVSSITNCVAPIYGASSTLVYNSATTYNRFFEWSAAGVGTIGTTAGYPNNVTIQNGSTLNLSNSDNADRALAGNLSLGSGTTSNGSLNMEAMTGKLTVNGNLLIGGNTVSGTSTLTLSSAFASAAIEVAGNWTRNTTGVFTDNGRGTFFIGSGTSTITTNNTAQFSYFFANKTSGGSVSLANGINVSNTLAIASGAKMNLGTFASASGTLSLGGSSQGGGTSYGGTSSLATTINTTYFDTNTGYLNVGTCGSYSLTSTTLSSPSCNGNTVSVNLANTTTANLPVGTYQVYYTLSGVNTGSFNTSMNVTTAGSGTFTTGALSTSGSTTITIDYIRNSCVSNTSAGNTVTFTVSNPSTASIITGDASICSGSSTNLSVAITGGTSPYTVVYSAGTLNSYVSGTSISVSPSSTTTYTITSVTDANGCIGLGNSGSAVVSIDATTSTDGGATWSNGSPSATKSLFFDGSTGTVSANLAGCSLRLINNAAVTVSSGVTVTLEGRLTVDAGSSFTLNNNANLLQNTTLSNSGNIVVKRNSSSLKRLDYTLWSSPVTGQGLYSFSPLTSVVPNIRFYQYLTSTNLYNNSLGFSITNLDGNNVNGTDSNNIQFAQAKGYLIRTPWNHPTAATVWNGTFTGVPNNGNITYTMANIGAGQRFNLVGNPYPSPISVSQFVSDNSTAITGTLYFWRRTNTTNNDNAYCSLAGGTFVSNNQDQAANPNGIIRTGQGFFVEALNDATTLNFNNGQRSSNTSNQFFRLNNNVVSDVETNRFWLNLTNTAGAFSQMAAGYMTDATNGVDSYDGRNINTGDVLLNSILDNTEYTIQGKALPFNPSDVIPLRYKITTAGTYTIAIDHVDGLFTTGAQAIYLKDTVTATEHNLQTGAYNFASDAGTFTDRFEIIFQSQLGIGTPTFNENTIVIYTQNNDFVVNTGTIVMASIKVFDIRGRLLQEKKAINASQTKIDSGLANQVLLVQITSEDGVVVTKKVVR